MPEAGQANFGKQPRGDLRRQRDEARSENQALQLRVNSLMAALLARETEQEQRTIRLSAAIRQEHFAMDGTNVSMNMPQHEKSIQACQHPLCQALEETKAR